MRLQIKDFQLKCVNIWLTICFHRKQHLPLRPLYGCLAFLHCTALNSKCCRSKNWLPNKVIRVVNKFAVRLVYSMAISVIVVQYLLPSYFPLINCKNFAFVTKAVIFEVIQNGLKFRLHCPLLRRSKSKQTAM